MTLLVGIHCTDGAVIAADSASTFGNPGAFTITHPVQKIAILHHEVVVACTGHTGLAQRFEAAVGDLYKSPGWKGSAIEKGKAMAARGIQDFGQTGMRPGSFGALVAFLQQGKAELCEYQVADFQPDLKSPQCWYVSMGSGQSLADPYLALMRMSFWRDGPPALQSGIFAAAWVMHHAIAAAPGFIGLPIHMAVLEDGKARLLESEELEEHLTHVKESIEHFRAFEDKLMEPTDSPPLPTPPQG